MNPVPHRSLPAERALRARHRICACMAAIFAVCAALSQTSVVAAATISTAPDQALAPSAMRNLEASDSAAPVEEEHKISQFAVPLFYGIGGHAAEIDPLTGKVTSPAAFGPFALTNSMLMMWIVTVLILLFARHATRQIKQIPDGAQNFWEWLVEGLRNFLENIIGRHLTAKTFWFFASVFIFILAANWFGLLPGVGTIGWGHPNAEGSLEHIDHPLFRGINADLNMTLAMSCIFFVCWVVWAIQENGVGGALLHVFGPKGASKGVVKVLMVFIFFCVGCLEVVSILMRPVSLSFRLYGNIFAGENVLEAMSTKVPSLAAILPIPFYFMELLVGLVQALVFMLLTAVFTLLICSHEDEPHAEHH